ncbi:hypothetical protein BJ165DRAFT_1074957 [Panaeolus papilionaceus]|nr:hypothetical protein BJ165DRAFT_1074957 [Panaeolus papilionaceus]
MATIASPHTTSSTTSNPHSTSISDPNSSANPRPTPLHATFRSSLTRRALHVSTGNDVLEGMNDGPKPGIGGAEHEREVGLGRGEAEAEAEIEEAEHWWEGGSSSSDSDSLSFPYGQTHSGMPRSASALNAEYDSVYLDLGAESESWWCGVERADWVCVWGWAGPDADADAEGRGEREGGREGGEEDEGEC